MSVVLLKRTRPETCLSDLAMDRLLAEELSKEGEREARKHLFGCLECTARMSTLKAGRDAFLADPAPHLFVVKSSAEEAAAPVIPLWRRALRSKIAGGAIAAGAVLFGVMLSVAQQDESGTRRKGSAQQLGFYVKHETEVRRGNSGEVVAPGDSLRFTYSIEEPKHLAIIGVDAADKASVYFPEGQVTSEMPEGRDVALPLAALLDETLGRETIYGVFCEQPVSVEKMRAAFESGVSSAPEGCALEKMTIEKR